MTSHHPLSLECKMQNCSMLLILMKLDIKIKNRCFQQSDVQSECEWAGRNDPRNRTRSRSLATLHPEVKLTLMVI